MYILASTPKPPQIHPKRWLLSRQRELKRHPEWLTEDGQEGLESLKTWIKFEQLEVEVSDGQTSPLSWLLTRALRSHGNQVESPRAVERTCIIRWFMCVSTETEHACCSCAEHVYLGKDLLACEPKHFPCQSQCHLYCNVYAKYGGQCYESLLQPVIGITFFSN